jgi:hypothetical protein
MWDWLSASGPVWLALGAVETSSSAPVMSPITGRSRFGTEAAEVAEELLARVRMVGARIGMGQRGRVGFGDGRLCAIGAVAARSPSALAAVPGPTTRARRCALVLRDRRCRPLLLLSMR